MNYRSVAQLDTDIVRWLGKLPRDIEVVVGVPRSGLLVANLLALHLNRPMTDVEGLLASRTFSAGYRYKGGDRNTLLNERRNVLVVDDSVLTGRQLTEVKAAIDAASLPHRIQYAAPYVTRDGQKKVDFFCEVVPLPRTFEWNLMHQQLILSRSCMDIDGVLCHDPSPQQNDDGTEYARFLECAEPLYLPTRPVGWLVTSRLERYRAQTEAWLDAHGVAYGELVMMQYPDMAARRAARAYASFKASVYEETGAWLFIESSPTISRKIAELTGKSVFCMETREMVVPGL
ncbi:MAG: orotate phosphoribosyltransferase, partial [Gemmatimonadota bacterium]|nr:orotate phosphoribosyltransferase [Gemmatimonadota bacterium]